MIVRLTLFLGCAFLLMQCQGGGEGDKRSYFITKKNDKTLCKGELKEGKRIGNWSYTFENCNQEIKWSDVKKGTISFYVPSNWEHLNLDSLEMCYVKGVFCSNNMHIQLANVPFKGDISSTDITGMLSDHLGGNLTKYYVGFELVESYYSNVHSLFQHSKVQIDNEEVNIMSLYFISEKKLLCLTQFFKGENYQAHKYLMFDFLIGMRGKGKELFSIQQAFDYIQPDFDDYETLNELELTD